MSRRYVVVRWKRLSSHRSVLRHSIQGRQWIPTEYHPKPGGQCMPGDHGSNFHHFGNDCLVIIAVRYGRAIHAYVDVINCPTANAMRTCVRRSVTVLLLDVRRDSFLSVPVNLTIADDLKQYPRPRNERNNIRRWLDEWAAIVFSALIVFSGSQYQRFWFDNHIYVMNSQLHSVVSNWYSDWACRDNIPVQVIDCLSNVILVVFIQRRFTSHLAPWEMMWEYISRVEW